MVLEALRKARAGIDPEVPFLQTIFSPLTIAQKMTDGQIVDQFGLPPKILIVHRFTEGMLRDDAKLEAVPGVQLVIDFDGYGEPAIKQELYRVFTGDRSEANLRLYRREGYVEILTVK